VQAAHSVLWPRLLTSAFTLLLLSAFFATVYRVSGLPAAAIATSLLIASPGFIELSSSCMLEIPALAFAVCALGVLVTCPRHRRCGWEIVAGVLFGLALLAKLVPLILLPLTALVIGTGPAPKQPEALLVPCAGHYLASRPLG